MNIVTPSPHPYQVNEIFYTLHGEGRRYGIPHVFVRFTGCNLSCSFCDTEYESGTALTADEILTWATEATQLPPPSPCVTIPRAVFHGTPALTAPCRNVLFCGGEPLLQLDQPLVDTFKQAGWFVAVETNGTRPIPSGIDWVTCSPKVAEHAIVPTWVNELKYARGLGQGIPNPACKADHYLLSPVFEGNHLDPRVLAHCVALVKANPTWALTIQHHKLTFGGIR